MVELVISDGKLHEAKVDRSGGIICGQTIQIVSVSLFEKSELASALQLERNTSDSPDGGKQLTLIITIDNTANEHITSDCPSSYYDVAIVDEPHIAGPIGLRFEERRPAKRLCVLGRRPGCHKSCIALQRGAIYHRRGWHVRGALR